MSRFAAIAALAVCLTSSLAARAAEDFEFFEKRIRPLLAEHCYKCHSADAKELKGGLRLDSRDGLLKGGDSGPAIVRGDPEASLLIKAVRHSSQDLKMPDKAPKLAESQITDLVAWVKMGALMPGGESAKGATPEVQITKPGPDLDTARRQWAFQPPKPQTPPRVKDERWARTPVDRFILAKLESKKLFHAPPADKRTLIRRATFDLIGLPPTSDEVGAFLADTSTNAFANVVERLLASPHYGEQWGRHWLDVVRYADSLDSRGSGKEGDILDAWRYRDWVVDAFNRDLPYDQFIIQQVAGDILAAQSKDDFDPAFIVATGLYAIGNWGNGDSDKQKVHADIVDDQVDVTSRAFLGLTLGCARCHDHKFDPLTQRDYYGLAGFFFSSHILAKFAAPTAGEAIMRIPLASPAEQAQRDELQKRISAIEAKLDGGLSPLTEVKRDVAGKPGLIGWHPKGADNPSLVINTTDAEVKFITITLPPRAICLHPGLKQPVTAAWRSPLAGRVRVSAKLRDADPNCGDGITWAVKRGGEVLGKGEFDNGGRADFGEKETTVTIGDLVQVVIGPRKGYECDSTQVEFVIRADDGKTWSLHEALVAGAKQGQDNLWWICAGEGERLGQDTADFTALETERKKFVAEMRPLPMTHGLQEGGIPKTGYEGFHDARVHIRGRYDRLGETVPRSFPVVLARDAKPNITSGSGRLELAKWLASADNPLTARVMVNRLWQHHFGEGIVRTPNNFGKLGAPPTHPELLDWLAGEFVKSGWSVKAMHRLIMASAVYQQSSVAADVRRLTLSETRRSQSLLTSAATGGTTADPENLFFSRQSRRRLDAESLRDTLLAVSGQLDLQTGGPAVRDIAAPRRTLYLITVRSDRANYQSLFDGADSTSIVEKRTEATVAPQALFLMNHPFVLAQVKSVAARVAAMTQDDAGKIGWLYQTLYARPPSKAELEVGLGLLRAAPSAKTTDGAAWEPYCQVLLCANEFIYVD
ncbi:MAG: PSD1 domain-containing protein [Verrucomicrobia bacterium]|nr:PSD1 domain-containing protein [Verrucomicrobiota bacterium]